MYISQRNVIWLGYVTMQIRTWYVNHYNGVAASRSFDVSFLFCFEVFGNFRWHDLDARRVLTNYYCNALIILGRRDARSQVCPNSGCRIKRGAVCLVFFFLYFEDNYASRTTLQNEFSGNNLSDSSKRLTRQARKS